MSAILLIDDDQNVVTGLQEILSARAITSSFATDPDAAVALVSSEFFPVVLSDLRFRTDDDGLYLIEKIRRISPRSRVAAMTGCATPEIEARVLRSGAVTLLQKPFDTDLLIDVIGPFENADYETIYRATASQLRAMMRRYQLSSDECDDILQQAWCLLLEKRGEVRDVGAWLSGTVMNLSRQMIHRNVKERPMDGEDRPFTENRVMTLAVQRALSHLDDRSRTLCELISLEQLSYAEVSERLSIPLGSVGPLYKRAKERLRRQLAN